MQTRQTQNSFAGTKRYRDFRETGPWFEENMTMVTRRNKLYKAVSFHLYNIRRIRKYLTGETTQFLVYAIVIGRADYCNSLLCNTPAKHIAKIQRI